MENAETAEGGNTTVNTVGISSGLGGSSLNATVTVPPLYIANGGTNNTTMSPPKYDRGLMVNGDAEFQGDVKINGKSIVETLGAIEKRLSILTPDPKKLAKYEALQKAYANYKTMEALCYDDE